MNAVVVEAPREMVATAPQEVTPAQMLAVAVQQGADLQKLEKLMDLQERWEANKARKAFVAAMAGFKSEPMRILKTKNVSIPGGAKFSHATLADVVDGVVSALSRHGLSHKWETVQSANGITVTCVITHEAGHSERVMLTAPPDDSGKKNTIQQIASTVTYLERYTLMAACGLAAKDMDDDGRGASNKPEVPVPPDGYQKWKDDLRAVSEEGKERLLQTWKASEMALRSYMTKHEAAWWEETKKIADRAQVAE